MPSGYTRNNPALPALTPNLWQIVLKGRIEGQSTFNTFYYHDGGGVVGPTTETTAMAAWQSMMATFWAPMISTDWLAVSVTMESLTQLTRVPVTVAGLAGMNGSVVGGHADTMLAITLLRQSGYRGQCGRGRLALPGCPLTFVTQSSLSAAGLLAIVPNSTALANTFADGPTTYTPHIYSKGSHFAPTRGSAPVLTTGWDSVIGTCRRRKLGRGI